MRVTSPAVTIKDIWDALAASYTAAGSFGKLLNDYLDAPVSGAKADLTTLETRLSAARALLLDNLDATISSRLATASYTTERGTDGAALASAWTAALATILGNFSAARIGYLDNIDSSLKELFYEHFKVEVDDLPDAAVSGTATNPDNLFDNSVANNVVYDAVNEYVEIDLDGSAYIKEFRYYGWNSHSEDGAYKIQAYIGGAWTDVKTGIPTRPGSWSSWTALTTPSVAIRWRIVATSLDSFMGQNKPAEWELRGVRIG